MCFMKCELTDEMIRDIVARYPELQRSPWAETLTHVRAEQAESNASAEALGAFLDDWEAQHGALTPEELARAGDEMRPLPPRQ
jgi:hypothetical protein